VAKYYNKHELGILRPRYLEGRGRLPDELVTIVQRAGLKKAAQVLI